MKKNLLNGPVRHYVNVKQIDRTMRLTLLAVFLFCMQLSARSQKDIKLSLNVKDTKLSHVLEKIESATGCRFFYNSREAGLRKSVSYTTNGTQKLTDILTSLLAASNLNYKILSDSVIAITASPDARFLTVRGVVKDNKGTLLPGVTILVKGTSTGTVTSPEGRFELNVPEDAVLVVTYVGFQMREVPVNGRALLEIVLEEELKGLNEVIVVGYGT